MTAYAVRIAKTHEFVGIFWGKSLAHACLRVDEFTEMNACEYKPLSWGGIYWDRRDDIAVPRPAELLKRVIEDLEEGEIWPGDAAVHLSEELTKPLLEEPKGWRPFDAATIVAAHQIMQESLAGIFNA
ncbi:MAG: hypothetical protein ACRECF_08615 [Methyloceanibacter sp.]